ncbi:type II toxin-antitoxin system RelE/ParE family toxin [Tsukamurella soli]|uniref:type II toxin-antitoxin system RelE/ParE family toxin n=1 Tax=Tsukamurella soli TaxID=644556 RepID=UPI0031EA2990
MSDPDTPISWVGATLSDMREQPPSAQRMMGFQLRRVQRGLEPQNWRPMPSIGKGVREIRVKDSDGIYRTVYVVVGDPSAVYVLAVFAKKTEKTPQSVKDLAAKRYKAVIEKSRKGEQQ